MPLAMSQTAPLGHLLSRIGQLTYRLNTICVGLESVAGGHGESGSFPVFWTKPKTPEQARKVADSARSFACSGALVLAADLFESYIREVALEDWLSYSKSAMEVAAKTKTRPKSQGGDYTVAERADALCSDLAISEPVNVAALDLLTKWRNVTAHTKDREIRLDEDRVKELVEGATALRTRRSSGFDVNDALQRFRRREAPNSTDVTTLVAGSVRLMRTIDEAAIRRAASTTQQMRAIAEAILRKHFDPSGRGLQSIRKEMLTFAHSRPSHRHYMLRSILQSSGITNGKRHVSAILDPSYLQELSTMLQRDFEDRFGIPLPRRSERRATNTNG